MTSKIQFNNLFRAARLVVFASILLGQIFFVPAASAKQTIYNFQDLETFTASVQNGQSSTVTGVYVHDVMAYPVVQQPSGNAAYVSNEKDVVTQFGMAKEMGNIGLLAHNTLAGASFSNVKQGDIIYIVYGDGHTETYSVTQVLQYQALDPYSPYSEFKDLATQTTLTANDLFNKVYRGEKHVILQTCIAANDNASWGRLFVIAEPVTLTTQVDDTNFHTNFNLKFWR